MTGSQPGKGAGAGTGGRRQQQIAAAVGIEKSNLSQVQTHTHTYSPAIHLHIDNMQSRTRMPVAIVAYPSTPLYSPSPSLSPLRSFLLQILINCRCYLFEELANGVRVLGTHICRLLSLAM